ncbi:hypothetical protein DSAG12_02768 [Promethearchaeum syntrophicum]|uniref:Chloroplast import component protein (Tic20) n=1 Tax=Promethearchaeum syntrophicum TaxID=2594042 RepID=A0A5B9DDI5_9ARCH|nr:hypothetical protein [Candidatus Prometheoarchaeum syntrophicum]QEE16937.1 hypothetical protein DSAG12_02768 [Candidatus Prometheoarchaeum syntrophicum]
MEPIQVLSLVCSSIGAVLFLVAVIFELKIIKKLKQIKKSVSWNILTFFTIFFILGYVVNIVSIIGEFLVLQQVFGALVFLFGAIFLLLIIIVSYNTYGAIFDAAETS